MVYRIGLYIGKINFHAKCQHGLQACSKYDPSVHISSIKITVWKNGKLFSEANSIRMVLRRSVEFYCTVYCGLFRGDGRLHACSSQHPEAPRELIAAHFQREN